MKVKGFDYEVLQRLNADARFAAQHKLSKLRRRQRRLARERFKAVNA